MDEKPIRPGGAPIQPELDPPVGEPTMPHFTVVQRVGHEERRFCANHLSVARSELGEPVLAFVCSGALLQIRHDQVVDVQYYQTGRTWCDSCDQPLPIRAVPREEPS